jgi:branched-chain amino acid transport system permease protein
MQLFAQQIVDGIVTGSIYATLALALVLIHRATHFLNFAQGEMGLFGTYFAWQLTQWGLSIWVAALISLVMSFALGVAVERVIIRPLPRSSQAALIIVGLGLFLAFNETTSLIWTGGPFTVPGLFGSHVLRIGGVALTSQSLGVIAALVIEVALMWLLFNRSRIGLAMRAAAKDPDSTALRGVRISQTTALAWGIAAVMGTLAGILITPITFLEPTTMISVLPYALAAATLGGLDSPVGAIAGGLVLGVVASLSQTYISSLGSSASAAVPLVIIVVVLALRPNGLFGQAEVVRA